MPVVPVPMECSHRTATGPISLLLLSSLLKARKPPSSFASRLLPEAVEVPIPLAMFTALQLASIPMKETLVCTSILENFSRPCILWETDIVGNNVPVFFIQDAIKFPDLVHAVKPRGDNEIPQAATAHDSAWDFFSQQPSSLHTLLWAMAGHGIPRSFRHVDGFGVHTFRLVTNSGKFKLVKFHWKTLQGKASLVWEEAQQASGKNADYMRQDLYDAIEAGRFPEWEVRFPIFICRHNLLITCSLVSKSWTKTISSDSALIFSTRPRSFLRNLFPSPSWARCS